MIWVKRIALILLIVFLGTIIDYLVHHLSVYFSVPQSYFPHKIFYGTLWGFVGYLVFKKYIKTYLQLAFVIAAVPAVLLQTMYFIQKHQLPWVVVLFLFLHFFMFLIPGLYICKKYKNIFLAPPSPKV
ncbi:MAG TPA: hypothetical protein VGQ87_02175 [Patescibacteria group bacterium]|jgi:hypothetical protein|nr:hypothetical protein [Patescibacteria group bacterium]